MSDKTKYIASLVLGALCVTTVSAHVEQPDSLVGKDEVQVAFRQIPSKDVIGGVSFLNMEQLQNKNYNYDVSNLEAYVPGYTGNSFWGLDDSPLVIIDGVPRDMNNISAEEVEEITFLKSAPAVVLYGSRAAKGVIYIKTKRGKDQPIQINVKANTGWKVAKSFPNYLRAAEYMTLYNEACLNDGIGAAYSQNDIYRTAAGTNPYRYPDLDLYSSEYVKKAYNRSDIGIEIKGGNNKARYYSYVSYFREGDLIDFGKAKDNYTDRLNVRGNVDITFNPIVSAYVDAAATFYGAQSAQTDFWNTAANLRPNRIAPLIPVSYISPEAASALDLIRGSNFIVDGKFLSGTSIDQTNAIADGYVKGDNKFTSRQFQFNCGLDFNLDPFVKGLGVHTRFAIDYATSYNSGYTDSYATYVPVWASVNGKDEIIELTKEGKDEHSGVQWLGGSSDRQTIYFDVNVDYRRTFNTAHNLSAILVASGWQRTFSGEYHKTSNVNLGLQIDYNYKSRYFAQLGMAAIHSARLAPGHRQAFSPTAMIGWSIANEPFMDDQNVVNNLTLSVSGGILNTDLDIQGYYLYAPAYAEGGWFSWPGASGSTATYPERGGNPDMTFVKRKELSANIHSEFFDGKLALDAEGFISEMNGLLINNSTLYPTYFSTFYPTSSLVPWRNYNNDRRTGFDFGIKYNDTWDQVSFSAGVNATYYTTKATRRDEQNVYDYQNSEGQALDVIRGYRCLGFFNSYDEIKNSPDQSQLGGVNIQPGDLKYADINGDNVINSDDQVVLGKGGWAGSPFVLGVNLTAKWKDFTLFVLGVGNFGAQAVKSSSYYWVYGDRKYSAEVRNRWTPETAETATYPRLTTTNGANNFQTSDFWMYNTDRFEIAKVQLTYDMPGRWFSGKVVKGLSAYASVSNLCTIGKHHRIMELSTGSAPQTRWFNIGANIKF